MIKKISYVLLMGVFLMPMFMFTTSINASNKTLRDLYNELSKMQSELDDVNRNKNLTEDKINQIKDNINRIDKEVVDIKNTMESISKEVIQLNEDIHTKDEEIKELMTFLQLSSGENVYLEYVFGAQSLTDFIYRLAITEQLTKHNDKLIDDMNNMIINQEKKSKELGIHQENIIVKREEMFTEQFKLGDRVESLSDDVVSIREEIATAKKTIKNYENLGCRPSDRLSDCINVNKDVSFSRPTNRGTITCRWSCYLYGKFYDHRAIDIAGPGISGETIYPTANGTVVGTGYYSDGGNYVIIQHNINGKPYASRYLHMAKVFVRPDQKVSRDTPIGTVGNTGSASTGPHLHFNIAKGFYGQDFWNFHTAAVDPATLINFPAEGYAYYSRYGR